MDALRRIKNLGFCKNEEQTTKYKHGISQILNQNHSPPQPPIPQQTHPTLICRPINNQNLNPLSFSFYLSDSKAFSLSILTLQKCRNDLSVSPTTLTFSFFISKQNPFLLSLIQLNNIVSKHLNFFFDGSDNSEHQGGGWNVVVWFVINISSLSFSATTCCNSFEFGFTIDLKNLTIHKKFCWVQIFSSLLELWCYYIERNFGDWASLVQFHVLIE